MPDITTTKRRVALYVRVSTTRQAENELSIPDQIRQGRDYCAARKLELIETFVEPGASATDDRRPEFQRMIDAAVSSTHPFDLVLVHSTSRFFREQFLAEMYLRKLRKAGVDLVSMTQEFGDGTTGNLIRQILGSFDEYQSRENAKHTLRAMQENARQGFWNGARPPFGYRIVAAEKRGTKVKKVLAIDEGEAATVRRIFDLALGRAGMPLGVKAIVNRLNADKDRNRGKPFHISSVHRILTATTYTGTHHFDRRDSRTGRSKALEQWIAVSVPPIIDADPFAQAQASLRARSPKRVPPRLVGNPTLLTGIARCGTCHAGMTLRTGKSGRYRYYTCAGCAQKGKTHCPGRSISMAALDGMVLEHLAERLFTPERLQIVLEAYVARSGEAAVQRREQLGQARRAATEAQGRLNRLLELVEQGLIDVNDPTLKERLYASRLTREAAAERVRLLDTESASGPAAINSDSITRLATALRGALQSDDPAFRKAYLRLFVDEVIVGDSEIRMRGPRAALAKATAIGALPPAGGVVPSFVRQWRPVRDSNPCYRRERAVSWASRRTGRGRKRRKSASCRLFAPVFPRLHSELLNVPAGKPMASIRANAALDTISGRRRLAPWRAPCWRGVRPGARVGRGRGTPDAATGARRRGRPANTGGRRRCARPTHRLWTPRRSGLRNRQRRRG
jgi:site-specific DNA recombinase